MFGNPHQKCQRSSHRTQFLQRFLEFTQNYHLTIRLAYYPPYQSKYKAVERCWGILEHHWNGALLDSVDAVLHFAQTMTWKGKHPVVELVTSTYQTGVKLTKDAMHVVETHRSVMVFLGKMVRCYSLFSAIRETTGIASGFAREITVSEAATRASSHKTAS